jgi:hypothetical protein
VLFVIFVLNKLVSDWYMVLGLYLALALAIKALYSRVFYFEDDCSYNVGAYTIINKPHTKLFELLDNIKLRKEWDHFLTQEEIVVYPEVCYY